MTVKELINPEVFYFLTSVGILDDEDLEYLVRKRDRIWYLLTNFDDLKMRYRPSVLINYMKRFIVTKKAETILDKLKIINLMLLTIPEARLPVLASFISQVLAELEEEMRLRGIMDHHIQNIFNGLYDELTKEKVRLRYVLTQLARLYGLAKTKGMQPIETSVAIERTEERVSNQQIEQAILQFVKEHEPTTVKEIVTNILEQFEGKVKTPVIIYKTITSLIRRKYLEQKEGQIRLTDKGKEALQ